MVTLILVGMAILGVTMYVVSLGSLPGELRGMMHGRRIRASGFPLVGVLLVWTAYGMSPLEDLTWVPFSMLVLELMLGLALRGYVQRLPE